tara:strand:- start:1531 stop:2115 length:585 start_codon:yes stop_codon:yes gene_type:complete
MAIQINGSGTITGISSGGLPAGCITSATLDPQARGKILQVVQTVKKDTFSTTSFQSYTDIGPQGTITASAAGNKIMVEIMLNASCDSGRHIAFRLAKDGSGLATAEGDAAGSHRKRGCFHMYSEDQNGKHNQTNYFLKFLDTAADTNAHTYNIQCIDWGGQGTTQITCNRSENDTDNSYESRTISTVTLTEIAA